MVDVEKVILDALRVRDGRISTDFVGLKPDEVNRALLWLESKGLVRVESRVKEVIFLGLNGIRYVKEGLPERVLVRLVIDGFNGIVELRKRLGDDFNVAIGILKENGYVIVSKGVVSVTKAGRVWFRSKDYALDLLCKLPVSFDSLSKRFQGLVDLLFTRKEILKRDLVVEKTVYLRD